MESYEKWGPEHCRNHQTIEILATREKEYKKIINNQAKKHKDNTGIDEMNKMISIIDNIPGKIIFSKILSFGDTEDIRELSLREVEYKKIITNQAKKHNDNSAIDEMNKVISEYDLP